MDQKIQINEFFKQQFKRKLFLLLRTFLCFGSLLQVIDLFVSLAFPQISNPLFSIILTAWLIPLFDFFALQDPLNTDSYHPIKYWIFAFFGDYQTVSDGLKQAQQKANERYKVARNLYENKTKRLQKHSSQATLFPLTDIPSDNSPGKIDRPTQRVLLIAALITLACYFTLYIGDNFTLLNSGFKLMLIGMIIFTFTPPIELKLSALPHQMTHVEFWQYMMVGHLDQHILRLTQAISRINKRTQALTSASHDLDKQLD